MRMRAWGVAGLATVLVSTACASSKQGPSAAPTSPAPATSTAPQTFDPLLLVGSWNVLTPAGKPTPYHLRIGDELTLTTQCGTWIGTWTANAIGMFLAEIDGGPGSCSTNARGPAPSWLTAAAAFTVSGSTRNLLDDAGHVVARLWHGHGIELQPDLRQLRARLATGPPLPGEQTPATAKTILGRWEPIPPPGTMQTPGQAQPPSSFVTFAADGSWSGSDGCNAQGGRWRIGPGGSLVTTAGPSTLIGCAGFPVGSWVSQARRAGLDGSMLVLLDAGGHDVAQLGRV